MYKSLVTLCLLAALPVVVQSYYRFRESIPNGDHVPHPCKPNELWKGVGHFNVDGGGHRNPFGLDFKAAGLTWTKELCRKDSDGDGRTNGEELGDPDCVWQPDDLPARTTHITHPGICDNFDSLDCKRKTFDHVLFRNQEEWMADACKRKEFVCEGLDSPDVMNQTLRFPRTAVPAKETTYMCVLFDFQDPTEDVHMIATTPTIDNLEVMHHMVLFGCKGDVDIENGSPFECGMQPHSNCSGIIGLWTIGSNGECLPNITGRRMGVNGYKRVALQFHWNNPEKVPTYNDSSAMTLYYTKKLRPYNTGVLTVGNVYFAIPPRQKRVEVNSTCSSTCMSRKLSQTVYITSAANHMHYLGVSQSIEQIRDGKPIRYLTNDPLYSYDSPRGNRFDTPVELMPGDELRTRCHYNSMSRTTTTIFGDSTQQEMCFGFVSFYPETALINKYCTTFGSVSTCDPATLGGCDQSAFLARLDQYLRDAVIGNCTFHGPCFEECKALIVEVKRSEPCMRHADYWERLKKWLLGRGYQNMLFLGSLASCEPEIARDEALASIPAITTPGPSSEAAAVAQGGFIVGLLASLFAVIF